MSVEQRNQFFCHVYCKQKHPLEEAYNLQNNIPEPKYEELFKLYLLRKGVPKERVEINTTRGNPWNVKFHDMTYLVIFDQRYNPHGTLSIEFMRNMEQNKMGWFQYAHPDKLIVFVTEEDFYVVDFKGLKAWFTLHSDECTTQIVPKKGAKYHTLYYSVPTSKIQTEAWISMETKKKNEE